MKLLPLLFPTTPRFAAEPVAFWDFSKRESDGAKRFTAHGPNGAKTD